MKHVLPQPKPEVAAKLADARPFPAVALKLVALLSNEDCNLSDVAGCLATDPVLSGKLINRANAADQATYCETGSVQQAVSVLGLDRTREAALSIALASYAGPAVKAESLRPCFHHTLACALAASEIARLCGLRPADAYTMGLMHDIGRIGLLSAYPAEYEGLIAESGGRTEEMLRLEREHFSVDHAEAGEWLALRWKLPEPMVEAIARHHEPPAKTLDQVTVVHIACEVADALGYGVGLPAEDPGVDGIIAELPEWTRARLKERLPALKQGIAREIELFEASDTGATRRAEDEAEKDDARDATAGNAGIAGRSARWGLLTGVALLSLFLLLAAALYLRH